MIEERGERELGCSEGVIQISLHIYKHLNTDIYYYIHIEDPL